MWGAAPAACRVAGPGDCLGNMGRCRPYCAAACREAALGECGELAEPGLLGDWGWLGVS